MKQHLPILLTCLALAPGLPGQTVDQFLAEGRAYLADHNLTNAHARFSAAVALAPTHVTANALQGITRLFTLLDQPETQQLLDRLGFSPEGRNWYGWQSQLATNTNGAWLAPTNMSAAEVAAFCHDHALPEIQAAQTNFSFVTSTNFLLQLNINEAVFMGFFIDYGDFQLLRAGLHFLEQQLWVLHAHNLDLQLHTLSEIFAQEGDTLEQLLKNQPQLLRYAHPEDLPAARQALANAIARYFEGSAFIRNRPPRVSRLFNLDPDLRQDEAKFRDTLADVNAAFNQPQTLRAPQVHDNVEYQLWLGPYFDGAHPYRSLLPDWKGNAIVSGSLPDSTFGGIFSGLTRDQIEQDLGRNLSLAPRFQGALQITGGQLTLPVRIGGGRFVEMQASGNLRDWNRAGVVLGGPGVYGLTDTAYGSHRYRFYRLLNDPTNVPPPLNDQFASRFPLTGVRVETYGHNVGASSEPGEPDQWGASVWWTWTAPVSGLVEISVDGQEFEPNTVVYTGQTLGTLARQAVGNWTSFNATAGVSYQIRVSAPEWLGLSPSTGPFRLNLKMPPVVTVTQPTPMTVFSYPTAVTLSGSAIAPGSRVAAVSAAVEGLDLGRTTNSAFSFAWTNAVPDDNFTEDGYGYFKVSAWNEAGAKGVSWVPIQLRPANDNFSTRQLMPVGATMVRGNLIGATAEAGEPNVGGLTDRTVWYEGSVNWNGYITISVEWESERMGGTPALGIYAGPAVNSLYQVVFLPYDSGLNINQISGAVTNGMICQIAISAPGYNGAGAFVLRMAPYAEPVVSLTASLLPNLQDVKLEATASDPDGAVAGVSFYAGQRLLGRETNGVSGKYTFIWSNAPPGDYEFQAAARDSQGIYKRSDLVYLRVASNDYFQDRALLIGSPATATVSNTDATSEFGEPIHAGVAGWPSVWWTWTAPFSGSVTIDTIGSSFDTLLAVYVGFDLFSLAPVAADNDSGGNGTSRVQFNAQAGTTYQIAVDGVNGATGTVVLNLH